MQPAAAAAATAANALVDEFGAELVFSLEDTVTAGSGESDCIEYLLYRDTLVRLAALHGLETIEMQSLAEARASGRSDPLTPSERLVAELYFVFAFKKVSVEQMGTRGPVLTTPPHPPPAMPLPPPRPAPPPPPPVAPPSDKHESK